MKNNTLEDAVIYILVFCVSLLLAILVRISVLSLGVDDFTSRIVFFIALGLLIAVFFSIQVVIKALMIPFIGRGLSKIPFFKRKNRSRLEIVGKQEKKKEDRSLEQIRFENKLKEKKLKEEKLNAALTYTREAFASYLSDSDLDILCQNVHIYIDKIDFDNIKPVRVKGLTALDIRHFGWNIWSSDNTRNRTEIAEFLKLVFPDMFIEAVIESIKSHLKDEQRKGIIKIDESLFGNKID